LIIHCDIKIKDLVEDHAAGKTYDWPRPLCPACSGKLWGHGYTPRYFQECSSLIYLKRYRCTECHAVHTLRPKTHWRRFWPEFIRILQSIRSKITEGRWTRDFSRQRQAYWFKGLGIQLARNGHAGSLVTLKRLKALLTKSVIIATHSLTWFQMLTRMSLLLVPPVRLGMTA
jgi:hypothetical protein